MPASEMVQVLRSTLNCIDQMATPLAAHPPESVIIKDLCQPCCCLPPAPSVAQVSNELLHMAALKLQVAPVHPHGSLRRDVGLLQEALQSTTQHVSHQSMANRPNFRCWTRTFEIVCFQIMNITILKGAPTLCAKPRVSLGAGNCCHAA